MSRFGFKSLAAFAVFVGLSLTPYSAFGQHGGGGGHSGGGGGFHGGGGGGGFHGGGGFSHGSGGEVHGGGYSGGQRSFSARGDYRGGGSEGGRNQTSAGHALGEQSSAERSSNYRAAINDGQWHSFANQGSSSRGGEGRSSIGHSSTVSNSGARTSAQSEHATLSARNTGISDGAWHSFGTSRGASGSVSTAHVAPGWHGNGWGGGWHGNGWGGWHGHAWGCCYAGWGGWGFGLYWGFWGPTWGFGWSPWYSAYWYNPYWYSPYGYSPWAYGYPDYSYDWSTNPPPYAPIPSSDNSSVDTDSPGNYVMAPSPDYGDGPDSSVGST
jgi:hypothetical protein